MPRPNRALAFRAANALIGVLMAALMVAPIAALGRRLARGVLCAGLAIGALTAVGADALAEELRLLGSYRLPTGLKIAGNEVGGLSALDYDPATGRFFALSDERGDQQRAHFHILRIEVGEQGVVSVDFAERVALSDEAGAPYAPRAVDPEGLRLRPGGGFYWTHERDAAGVPFVGEMDAEGRRTRAFAPPPYHLPGDGVGVRRNLGYESLTIDAAGRVVAAAEQALRQDGPRASLSQRSPARVLVFDPESGAPVAEHVYLVDRIAAAPIPADGFATNGLVEMLATPEGGFYAMERSFSAGQGQFVRIYKTSFDGADDVLGQAVLPQDAAAMPKTLLLSLQVGGAVDQLDNLEGMTFGPEVAGRRTLFLISDNNFNPNGQFTQILAFTIEE